MPLESRYQLEKGLAVSRDCWRLGPPHNTPDFAPLFENKEEGTSLQLLQCTSRHSQMLLPMRIRHHLVLPWSQPSPVSVPVLGDHISCHGVGNGREEPAMVSDGDVLCFLTPAPVLQQQHSLTTRIIPGGPVPINPESTDPEALQSLHRAMGRVPSSCTDRDIQPQLRGQTPFQGPSQQIPTPALLGTSPGRTPIVLLPLDSASLRLLPGGQDRVTSWAGPR